MGVALVNGRTGAAPPLPTPMDAEGAADAGAAVAAAAAGGNAAAAGGGKADSALTESVRPLAFKTLVGKGHHEFSSARQQVRRRKKRVNFTVGRRPVYMLSCTHSTSMLSLSLSLSHTHASHLRSHSDLLKYRRTRPSTGATCSSWRPAPSTLAGRGWAWARTT